MQPSGEDHKAMAIFKARIARSRFMRLLTAQATRVAPRLRKEWEVAIAFSAVDSILGNAEALGNLTNGEVECVLLGHLVGPVTGEDVAVASSQPSSVTAGMQHAKQLTYPDHILTEGKLRGEAMQKPCRRRMTRCVKRSW